MRAGLTLAAAVLLLVASCAAPGGGGAGKNLIVNGGAEGAKGSPDAGVVPVPGWQATGTFTAVQYDTPDSDYMKKIDPGPTDRGANYFSGGPDSETSSGTQEIDVSRSAGAIDKGSVSFQLAGRLGGWDGQGDHATLTISFLDSGETTLGQVKIGPVGNQDRKGATGLLFRQATGRVPKKTRKIEVVLLLTRTDGVYNDGYADNLSLRLSGT